MSVPTENQKVSDAPIFDPFPEPNTMPAGWDLSGFIREAGPVFAAPADDSTRPSVS
jgi:hypothetical protein